MASVTVTDRIAVKTRGNCEGVDLSAQVQELVHRHAFREGQAKD